MFGNTFGRFALPPYLCSGMALTFSVYGMIRFFGKVGPKLYISFLSPFVGIYWGFAVLLRPAARMKEESQMLKQKMRRMGHLESDQWLYERALLRSLPDLGLRVDNYFVVQSGTHLTVMDFVVANAMSLLITL